MARRKNQDNGNQAAEQPELSKKRGAGFYAGVIIAAIALILALIFAVFAFMESTQAANPNRGGSVGQLEGKTEEEIIAELNKVVEEGMFNISIASSVTFEDGTSEGEVKIENSPANRYLMQVDIILDDTGQTVYSSPILEPNYHIQTAALDVDLDAGSYPATAVFHALDPETESEIGQAGAEMTLVVKN